jgi:putative protease
VNSLKIEGRTKSPYYVGRTAQVYRRAIDAAVRGEAFDESLFAELEGLANRGYTEGFLQRHKTQSLQNYEQGHSIGQQQVVGEVEGLTQQNRIGIDVKNNFALGDNLLLMTPSGNHRFILSELFDKEGNAIQVAPGSGHHVQITTPVFEGPEFEHQKFGRLDHAMLVKELPL